MNRIIDLDCPIHVVVTKRPSVSIQNTVIGIAQIEWRRVLHSGRISTLVELTDPTNPQMTVGILDIILEFLPNDGERMRKDEVDFHVYIKKLTW